ncbi:MAG: hypothetical protein L6Q76_38145 [Polyangiaceae bacterium]|nr:hypothetical protein [Polyangiaceae bacterium]
MIERWISRAGRRLSALAAAALFAVALPGCGPDCYVEATMTITIDPAVEVVAMRLLVIHSVSNKEEGDVTGTDPRGVPLGPAADRETGSTMELLANTRSYSIEVQTEPYPTYYYAFIDTNKDGKPGLDEPLGVAPGNPSDQGCDDSTIPIVIKAPAP